MIRIKIEARLNEDVDAEGVGYPKSVTVTGAEFLAPSAIVAIAQEAIKSYTGLEFSEYLAAMPDWDMVTDNITVPVIKRRV